MASINSQRPPSSLGTFLLGVTCLTVFAFALVFWVKNSAEQVDSVTTGRGLARLKKREELEKDWSSKLNVASWIDKEKAIVQVPIDDAIRATVVELKAKKVIQSPVKVPAPLPAPTVDPKSTEPPPPALPSGPQGAELIHFDAPNLAAPAVPVPALGTAAGSPSNTPNEPARPPLINSNEPK